MKKFFVVLPLLLAFLTHAQTTNVQIIKINELHSEGHHWYDLGDSSLSTYISHRTNDTLRIYQKLNTPLQVDKGRFILKTDSAITEGHFDKSLASKRPYVSAPYHYRKFILPTSMYNVYDFSYIGVDFYSLGLHGTVVSKSLHGNKILERFNYSHGVPHGLCESVYPSGAIRSEKYFVYGVPHGTWKLNDSSGKTNIYYNEGKEVFNEGFKENEKQYSQLAYNFRINYKNEEVDHMVFPSGDKIRYLEFYPNGSLKVDGYFSSVFDLDTMGIWHWYDSTGKQIRAKKFDFVIEEEYGIESVDEIFEYWQVTTPLELDRELQYKLDRIEWKKKETGKIILNVTFNKDGRVRNVNVVSFDEDMEKKLEEVKSVILNSRFRAPTLRNHVFSGEFQLLVVR